ncbi:hypothetical protein PIB30_079212 [Stylosanthes scabra]|uniref:Uncharacterized protein n=1 Tax=Stylosanthes scabra TaxID=79078 RepID=A0ABU6SR64_9FABA|nr:hypothetical protein [Stylosanthes scabra]
MKQKKLYLPVRLGRELQLFGKRSIWIVVGPATIVNRLFTFEAKNNNERKPSEFYFGLGWERFRNEYGLRTFDSLKFHIMNWKYKIMTISITSYIRGG